jgi:hypothetical protein
MKLGNALNISKLFSIKLPRASAIAVFVIITCFVFTGCFEEAPIEPPELSSSLTLENEWSSPLPQSNDLFGIWVDSLTSAIYCVGEFGTAVRFDASGATVVPVEGSPNLEAVWVSPGGNVYACGSGGLTWKLRSDDVFAIADPGPTNVALRDIWGSSDDDIFVVGDHGVIRHFDGSDWTAMDSRFDQTLFSVWGRSSSDVYAVGSDGMILHYDGDEWDSIPSPSERTLFSVWGFGEDKTYAVGQVGKVLGYDSSLDEWVDLDIETLSNLVSVWGTSDDNLFASSIDGTIYSFLQMDSVWLPLDTALAVTVWDLHGDPSKSGFYFCGVGGLVARGNPTEGFTLIAPRPLAPALRAIWGLHTDEVFAAGNNGIILAKDGEGWRLAAQGDTNDILDLWGDTKNSIFAAAGNRIIKFNGHAWTVTYDGDTLESYRSIWGRDSWDVYAAGESGRVIHFDGIGWTQIETGIDATIVSIRGTSDGFIFAATTNGSILKYDGAAWTTLHSDSRHQFRNLLVLNSQQIIAVGTDRLAVHFNNGAWRTMLWIGGNSFEDVWGLSYDRVFAVGSQGTIWYFNGEYWIEMPSNTSRNLHGIWGTELDRFYVVGDIGTILKYSVTQSD